MKVKGKGRRPQARRNGAPAISRQPMTQTNGAQV